MQFLSKPLNIPNSSYLTQNNLELILIQTSAKEDTKALMRTIRNNVSKKHRNKRKLRYVPIETTGEAYDPDQL